MQLFNNWLCTILLEEPGQVFVATPGPGKCASFGTEGGGHYGPWTLMTVVVSAIMEHPKTANINMKITSSCAGISNTHV